MSIAIKTMADTSFSDSVSSFCMAYVKPRNELRVEQLLGRCLLNCGSNKTLGAITGNSETSNNLGMLPVI